ncbi:hypothetical protein AAX05_00310 [Moraxella bovoculi]|uniref:Uncharacterized protein n=1 Tax=Moraxella bovoculi TaxID=386891 RepID=A0AAC8PU94_9GAMM|nr:hypothetical protein [Moraxella bovoculi]AKG06896.1 hypothetical protein AAX06_00310 [Moraxella bovoculi]AKG08885.1 hypothetical protein AAX05_00310 [Moraxella bovoculi]AKG10716.1 hypothetical protein AAX07_00310 [Moraxella bovoculi]AKG12755.1 hypothetical protein AAX11_00310 [Moraxella bovoculi]
MKRLSILALSATVAIAPAFAETTSHYTTPSVELSTQPTQATDLSFAFEDTQNLQATVMTDSQMQETEGAWGLLELWQVQVLVLGATWAMLLVVVNLVGEA